MRHYFDGVDALIAETYRATTATVGEAHAAAVAAAGADPRARLIAYVTASFRPPVADPALLAALEDPARQKAVASSRAPQEYKKALDVARKNAKALHDAGVRLTFGTDTGPPARFQGYFEHLELEELVKAGLSARDALLSATRDAAQCMGLTQHLGTLQPGRYADFMVLTRNPFGDVRNTRTIESVWISGKRLKRD